LVRDEIPNALSNRLHSANSTRQVDGAPVIDHNVLFFFKAQQDSQVHSEPNRDGEYEGRAYQPEEMPPAAPGVIYQHVAPLTGIGLEPYKKYK
jgi:hypothetical protein